MTDPTTMIPATTEQAPAKKARKPRGKKAEAPKSRSVIAAVYKKVHVMDKLSEQMSKLVRGGDANDPIDPKLFGQLCRANDIPANRWEGKNIGMQFMNLSNVLHHRAANGEKVTITLQPRKARAPKAQLTSQVPAIAAE